MNNVKVWRLKRELTQEEMKKKIDVELEKLYPHLKMGCSLRNYQKIESNNNPILTNIYLGLVIAKILNINPYELWK